MTRTTWAVVVAMGMGLAAPVLADDPAATDQGNARTAGAVRQDDAAGGAASTIQVEEVRSGAGSMEPAEAETPEERAERQFAESVWTVP
jgi:hypothetical protein